MFNLNDDQKDGVREQDAHGHDHDHHDHDHAHDHEHGHDHDHHDHGEEGLDFSDAATVTMVDEETGEEFEFYIVDDFDFEGEVFCVLVTVDEEEPEAVFVRVVTMEDGTEGFTTLEEDEFERVAEEYERLCELEADEYEDYDEEDDDEDDEDGDLADDELL